MHAWECEDSYYNVIFIVDITLRFLKITNIFVSDMCVPNTYYHTTTKVRHYVIMEFIMKSYKNFNVVLFTN